MADLGDFSFDDVSTTTTTHILHVSFSTPCNHSKLGSASAFAKFYNATPVIGQTEAQRKEVESMKKEMEGVKGKGKGKKDDGGKGKEEVEMSELLMVCRRDLERLDVGEGNVESEGEEKSEEGEEGLWTPTESVAGEGEGSH